VSLSGQWEGKLIDVTGVSGLLKLELKETRGRVDGDYSVYFLSAAEGGCCGPERHLVQSGTVSGEYDPKKQAVRIEYDISVAGSAARVSVEAALREALPHAKQALFGCYGINTEQADLSLEGGGLVLWQYA